MSIGFRPQSDPRTIPEAHLWTLHRDGYIVEARMRSTPLGPEPRVYFDDGLLWSQIPRDGRDFCAFVAERPGRLRGARLASRLKFTRTNRSLLDRCRDGRRYVASRGPSRVKLSI